MSLISPSELAALREVAESAMATTVTIKRKTNELTENGQKSTWPTIGTVQGMLYSGLSPVLTLVSGEIAAVGTVQLRVPVGTDIASGDRAVINGTTYIVSDTAVDDTWQAMLRCSLRVAE